MSTWVDRIKSRMKELSITQEMLATKMGITRGAVTHYLAGRRNPPLRQFQKMAAILKTDPAWLQFGTTATTTVSVPAKQTKQSSYLPLPILSWEQVADFKDATKLNEKTETIPHFFTDKPHWYALRVKGDAMTAPGGHKKSFHEGDLIVIDSENPVNNGDFVVAILSRAKEATFKQYVIDGGVHYLKPLNPQYPIIEIDKGTHICGKVIRCIN